MRVGGYVRAQVMMALSIVVADFVIFLIIGLPAALAVAVLAGLFEFIPVLAQGSGLALATYPRFGGATHVCQLLARANCSARIRQLVAAYLLSACIP
jgi:hypothetical protein